MHRFHGILLALALLLIAAPEAVAVPITQPADLNPGDQYRLVFVTAGTRDATSTSIADYNAFVASEATSVTALDDLATTWKAIASTSSVSARSNTTTDPVADGAGVPIYGTNGVLVASGNADLWDGSLASSISYDQDGALRGGGGAWQVFTGTDANGDPAKPLGLGPLYNAGLASSTDSGWIEGFTFAQNDILRPMYGLSGVLTVPAPEPGTGLMVAMGLALLSARGWGVAARRKYTGHRDSPGI